MLVKKRGWRPSGCGEGNVTNMDLPLCIAAEDSVIGVGPSSELTSCLLPDVTVELAQKTPFKQSLAAMNPRGSILAFCTSIFIYFT